MTTHAIVFTLGLFAVWPATIAAGEDHPLNAEQQARMREDFKKTIAETTELLKQQPESVGALSRRGDAYFFLGDYDKAVADYDRMIELKPDLGLSHWRRGIALFYAEKYDDAAAQFERYHQFDNVDRENGIWRFLSQARADDVQTARKNLLPYDKADREPLPAVYQLFAGTLTPEKIVTAISEADITDREREKRLFYAELYIGLNATAQQQPEVALPHLRAAVANTWAKDAGYGPNYMWHVARLHYDKLRAEASRLDRRMSLVLARRCD